MDDNIYNGNIPDSIIAANPFKHTASQHGNATDGVSDVSDSNSTESNTNGGVTSIYIPHSATQKNQSTELQNPANNCIAFSEFS